MLTLICCQRQKFKLHPEPKKILWLPCCFIGLHKLIFIKQMNLTLPFVNACYFLMELNAQWTEGVWVCWVSTILCVLVPSIVQSATVTSDTFKGNFTGTKLQATLNERLLYVQKLIYSSLSVVYWSITITIEYRVTYEQTTYPKYKTLACNCSCT